MEKAKRKKLVIWVLSLAALVAISPMAKAAGSLEPNAPPGPVMKSLDEVEPRIPIHASDLPLTITQPGSYYLTQDVNFTDTTHTPITIECNDVTIDLMGYTLRGQDTGPQYAIFWNYRTNITVRNGTVRDFHWSGIYGNNQGRGHQVINVRAISNYIGIVMNGWGGVIKDCTAVENSYFGIATGGACTITGNNVSYNGGNGIFTNAYCTITGNVSFFNGGSGIYMTAYCIVSGNTASYNTLDGIQAANVGNTITGNNCSYNGYNGDGAGIHATNTGNRIEENHVVNNDRGIDVDAANNLIIKNSATGNTVEYDVVAGNKFAAVSTDPNTAGPWANFDF
jgi:parallel beta-helix repeat protein